MGDFEGPEDFMDKKNSTESVLCVHIKIKIPSSNGKLIEMPVPST